MLDNVCKVDYDDVADVLYIVWDPEPSEFGDEIIPGVILRFANGNKPTGITIYCAKRVFGLLKFLDSDPIYANTNSF